MSGKQTAVRDPSCCLALTSWLVAGIAMNVLAAETPPIPVARGIDGGVPGGLCVWIGADDLAPARSLAEPGRHLVHVLAPDAGSVTAARRELQALGIYGLISVDRLPDSGRLPYTENLVNLLVLAGSPGERVAGEQIARVVCPGGTVLATPGADSADKLRTAGFTTLRSVEAGRDWLAATKPWPAEMDEWSHARHSAAGNAVSGDVQVGPPRRVRWVAGAESEVAGLVTSGGRNYYAGTLARDSFNGLRLWNRDLVQPGAQGPFQMKSLPATMPSPVAAGRLLFAVTGGKLLALDGASGETVREYPEAGQPQSLLHDRGLLFVADPTSVKALDAESGSLRWRFAASVPRHLVSGDECVGFVVGDARRGEQTEAVLLDRASGEVRWRRTDLAWAARVYRCVYHRGLLAYEVSTLNDDGPGNALHILSAADGKLNWERDFLPGMNHARQARAMFVGDRLWLLHGGKGAEKERFPVECSALNPDTGEVLVTHKAGLTHCFPPVATTRYLFAGEMDLTELASGEIDANRITKAACGRESGWVPANGLIYVTPKHCVCWPMLRGYAALAPERPEGDVADLSLEAIHFALERGVDPPPPSGETDAAGDWPCYRHDAWRSGSTPAVGPLNLDTLWTADLGQTPIVGPLVADWQENPFVKGPVTSPVVAGGTVVVARPDAHEVVALDAATGAVRWRYTACGRVDTAPTMHQGLCLFGTKNGWVYCLRVADGEMVWKRCAAPLDERIVAYGQLESPWPVPGSVLVSDGIAYFAAGRQSFADGGIFVFAVDPRTGSARWVQRLNTVPQQGFYECSALEFDNFDLLYRQGDGIAMSRWAFDRGHGNISVDRWSAFARLNTGEGEALVPRGSWSYAPRHQQRIAADSERKPLVVFRGSVLLGCVQGMRSVFRRDFRPEEIEKFDTHWITGWAAGQAFSQGQKPWPNDRLAEHSTWRVDLYDPKAGDEEVAALALAEDKLFLAGSRGDLCVLAADDGRLLARRELPAPLWDGIAVARGKLFVSTSDGKVVCLGERSQP